MCNSFLRRFFLVLTILMPAMAFAVNPQAQTYAQLSPLAGDSVKQQGANEKHDAIMRQQKSKEMKRAGTSTSHPQKAQKGSHYRSPKCMFVKP